MVTRLKHRAAAVVREALMRRPHQRRRVKLARLRTGRLVLGAVTVLGMMAGLWVAPAPVAADNSWHEESGEPWPDHGTYFSWCWDSSVGAALDHHISAAERLLENYTVVNVRRQSCGAHTDVRWENQPHRRMGIHLLYGYEYERALRQLHQHHRQGRHR